MTHNFSKTNYPEIYTKTYWGHNSGINEQVIGPIVENRNSFISEYNIKKYVSIDTKKYVRKIFDSVVGCDHPELYLTKENNLILIMSFYELPRVIHGWEIIKKLYEGSTTYMKMIPNKFRLNK